MGGHVGPVGTAPAGRRWVRLVRKWMASAILLWVCCAVLLIIVLSAVFAPWVAPHDPLMPDILRSMEPPQPGYWLGTDQLGRDVLSRLIWGARPSLFLSFAGVGLGLLVGGAIGVAAGYMGGRVDLVVMRLVDALMAFPGLVLAIAVVSAIGTGVGGIIVAVGVYSVPVFARVARAAVLGIKDAEYVQAARAVGASDTRIVTRHVLPNIMAPVLVQFTMRISTAILVASGLGFLGLGVQPPAPEWGAMLSDARSLVWSAPWAMIFPGVAILVVTLAVNIIGDILRDMLDPRLRD